MRKFFLVLSIAILSLVFATSCNSREIYVFFNTDCIIDLSGRNAKNVKTHISSFLNEADNTFSTSIVNSDIYRINSAPAFEIVCVNNSTIDLLNLCKEIYESDNSFNPAIFPIVELWNFSPDRFTGIEVSSIPEESIITETLLYCSFDNFVWDSETNSVYKKDTRSKIDLGGIAKGYACDKSFELAEEMQKAIINIGGTIKTNSEITVHIKNPRPETNQFAAKVAIPDNFAISTSGDYERYYFYDNLRYHHIFDPSGQPAWIKSNDPILSVSIIGPSAAICDALSTLIFINGLNSKMQIILNHYSCSALVLYTEHYEIYGDISIDFLENRYL